MKKIFFISTVLSFFIFISLFLLQKNVFAAFPYDYCVDGTTACMYLNNGASVYAGGYCMYNGNVSMISPTNCYTTEYSPGWCVDTCYGYLVRYGDYLGAASCNAGPPVSYTCQTTGGCSVTDGSQASATLWSTARLCSVSGSGPTGVDVKATVWTDGNRNVVFGNQLDSNGPVWGSSQFPYKISWGAVSGADSCTLNESAVSVSGGSINTYTFPYGEATSLTYTLSCTGSGVTTSDTVVLNVPPPPTNTTASCPVPGTSGTMSWTPPSGYNSFYTRVYDNTSSSYLLSGTQNGISGSSLNFNGTTVGHNYGWWMHTGYTLPSGAIALSDPPGGSFTCSAVSTCVAAGTGTGLIGKYYDGINLDTFVSAHVDPTINFNPGDSLGVTYANSADGNSFSVRWEGEVQPRCTENYTFYTNTNDGVRLWVNGVQLVNNWINKASEDVTAQVSLVAGQKYSIAMEYFENGGTSVAQLSWSSPSTAKAIVPQTQLYVKALTPNLIGKFNGSDTEGPIEVYDYATYNIRWGPVTGASSCTINSGSGAVATTTSSGGLNGVMDVNSRTYTLTCLDATGTPYSDTFVISRPPSPSNLNISCTGSVINSSWTLPGGYSNAYFRMNKNLASTTWPPWIYDDFSPTNSTTPGLTPGSSYTVYVHTKASDGDWGPLIYKDVTCPLLPVVNSFSTTPTSGTAPLSTTISWSSSNSTSCVASGGWSGTKATSGSQVVSGIGANTSFTLICGNGTSSTTPSTVNVTVTLPSYNLTVTKSVGGSVRSGDSLISCGSTCSRSYAQGTAVTLTAVPDSANWKFVGWSGACTGTSASCNVTVNGNTSVNAIFAPRAFIYQEF